MVKEKEIRSYFDKDQTERMSYTTRQDAIGFNYQEKCRWFFSQIRDIHGLVLDVGCNVGNLPFVCREYGLSAAQVHFTGIDITEKSINVAKARNISGTTFQVGSALNIEFPDNTFDGVTCMEVIEHIPDQPTAMREITRVLKTNGILALSTPNAECKPLLLEERLRFLACRMLGRKLVDKDSLLTLPELNKLLTDNNLTPLAETRYYWYHPYHVFHRHLWWPPRMVFKGFLKVVKECKNISESGQLAEEEERYYCSNMLAVAKKRTQ